MTPPQVIGPVRCPAMTRAALALFAGASGDHNPIHIDTDAARAAGLDDVIAPGMLSMAHLGRVLTATFGPGRLRRFQVRFNAVTPVHAVPVAHARLVEVDDGVAHYETVMTVGDGTVTLTGRAEVDLRPPVPAGEP